jgi:hypothetical protein
VKHAWIAALLLAACTGGNDDDAPPCEASAEAPDAPTILAPGPGRIDIIPAQLDIQLSPFTDPDPAAHHGGTQVEISNGTTVVWHAELDGHYTDVTLADGTFDWGSDLADWTDYTVHARYRDDNGDCSTWSAWSDDLAFKTDDGSTYLFDPTVIRDFYLTLPQASVDGINAQAVPPGCVPYERDYYEGSLTFEGVVYDHVGVHAKGGCGSARDLNGKTSLKIKLDWDDPADPGCPAGRTLYGQKHLTLNADVQDQTSEHERLGYEVYHELGVPTPRAATARVYINGTYYGVYTDVETIDRRFLSRWFGSNRGMLYEGTYWCDLLPQNVPATTDDSGCLTREFRDDACSVPDPGDDPLTYDLLRDLVTRIQNLPAGGFYPEVEQFFQFDTFLSQWAWESVISHWDAYEFSIQNNYRVYHDPSTDTWSMIPTGIDQTFGGDQDPWGVGGTLAARCLGEPDCEAAFADRLRTVKQLLVSDDVAARATAIYNQIHVDVENDPRKEFDNGTYLNAYNGVLGYIANRPARVDQILATHGF